MKQVLNLTDEQKHIIKTQYMLLCKDKLLEREYKNDDFSPRNNYQRDYARILYSPSFRRLQGKMQIVGVNASAFYRNRLTHSLEVAQIATSIAKMLSDTVGEMYSFEDIYVIEAAALAHDIGHPAFGHKGERVLNEIAKAHGLHFEGNAQNYRVLRHLEKKEHGHCGLNLTNRTLLAINKYIVKEDAAVEKFIFAEDYDRLMEFRKANNIPNERTLDVQIIELADDIAYAVHDLEDALSLNLCSVDDILFELGEKDNEAQSLFQNIIQEAQKNVKRTKDVENIQENSHLFRKTLTSILTNTFVHKLKVSTLSNEQCREYGVPEGTKELSLDENHKQLCKLLSKIIFNCAIKNSNIALYEAKGEIVIKTLFNIYSNELSNQKFNLLPPDYRPKEKASKIEIAQNVINYIAGMMDTCAILEHEKLTGKSFSTIDLST